MRLLHDLCHKEACAFLESTRGVFNNHLNRAAFVWSDREDLNLITVVRANERLFHRKRLHEGIHLLFGYNRDASFYASKANH